MAEYVQWDTVTQDNSGNGERNEYLRLKTGNSYRIRPLFKLVKFYKYFYKNDGKLRTAVCKDPVTPPVRDSHPDLGKPSLRYASYVIDRGDGKVKILEAPQSVWRPIGGSFAITAKNPGGSKDGSDWNITVTGKGLNTKYDVVFVENTPITKEERETINEAIDGDIEKLVKVYKENTLEEIEEKLFGEWRKPDEVVQTQTESESSPPATAPSQAQAQVQAQPQTQATAPATDDFEQNW